MNYTIKQFPDKVFTDKMDLTRFIKSNQKELMHIKKAEYKTESEIVLKSDVYIGGFEPKIDSNLGDIIELKTVINTTNVIDNHMDLHLKDIWNKTVKDNPYTYHLKLHKNEFEAVISNHAKNYNERMNFKDLGIDADFEMTANINQFILDKRKQDFMYGQYVDGNVKQHSVGMMYVDLDIAFYDEESQKEMDFFNEMMKQCINPEVAEERGFVYIVREAKKREGSAVVFGSNSITPTLWIKNYEPQTSTYKQVEPLNDTLKDELQLTKFINPNFY